jgi:hypothetical protein
MRLAAPTRAKMLLTLFLLAHLLIHPTLHAIPLVADAPAELSAPGGGEGDDTRGEGRAPCLACRIGSSALVAAVAAEPLAPNPRNEPVSVVDASFIFHPAPCTRPSRAPPLAVQM